MIAFFIDADNLCGSKSIEEALDILETSYGPVSIKRAYGSADRLKGLAEVCRKKSIRPFVNLSLSKNTTVVALAVDAIAISYQTPSPAVIAIGSGDVDFLPLVVRLRERGVHVVCMAEPGKMAPEARTSYDAIFLMGQAAGSDLPTEYSVSEAGKAVEMESAPSSAIASKAVNAAVKPAKSAAASDGSTKAFAKKATKKSSATTLQEVTVEDVLKAIPQLKERDWQTINSVAKQLREKQMLGKNASSIKLFGKYPDHFSLDPKSKPTQVRFIG